MPGIAENRAPAKDAIRRVLVADGSKAALRAVEFAAALASHVGAELRTSPRALPKDLLEGGRSWPADLMVVADLDSSADSILWDAACPVLVVPHRLDPRAPLRLERVLCPTDFSTPAQQALDWARRFVRAFAGRLTLLHVLEWFPAEAGGVPCVPEYHLDLEAEAQIRIGRELAGIDWEGIERELLVTSGRPPCEILRVARTARADLIALGVHGRRRLDRVLCGATLRHVARESPCPVLIVRPASEPSPEVEYQ